MSVQAGGGTATNILVHFPASFFSWLNDILRLSIASRTMASSFISLSFGMWNLRCAVSHQRLGRSGLWWVPVSTLGRT